MILVVNKAILLRIFRSCLFTTMTSGVTKVYHLLLQCNISRSDERRPEINHVPFGLKKDNLLISYREFARILVVATVASNE